MSYFNTDDATFNPQLEKINETDRVHADTPNKRFEQLIKNDVSLKNQLDIHNHDSLYSNINHKHSEYITNENLGTKLNNIAKETSEYNIENKVKEISISIGNINNSVSQNLQGVAKERSEYSIEDRVKNLEDNIPKFYYDLTHMYVNKEISSLSTSQEILLGEVSGQGELIHCFLRFQGQGTSTNETPTFKFKIVVDGEIKVFQNVYFLGDNQLTSIGFFSNVNIMGYYSNRRTPIADSGLFPVSFLPTTTYLATPNAKGRLNTEILTFGTGSCTMHPVSSQEKRININRFGSETYYSTGTFSQKPIKYKNKVQIYFTLLDRSSLRSFYLTSYFKK